MEKWLGRSTTGLVRAESSRRGARRPGRLAAAVVGAPSLTAGMLVATVVGAGPSRADTSVSIPVGDAPAGMAFDPINGYVYVSIPTTNNAGVVVIDGATNTVVTFVPTNILGTVIVNGIPTIAREGDGYPLGLAFDPLNGDIFVTESNSFKLQSDGTDLVADGTTVTVIDGNNDATANTVIDTVKVGNRPVAVAFDAANGSMYVANANDGTVSVIDSTTNTVTATVGPLGPYAKYVPLTDLAFDSANGDMYVTTQGGTNHNYEGYVSVIHGTTIVEPYVFPSNSQARLYGVTFDPVNGDVYVVDANGIVDVMNGSDSNFGTINTFIGSYGVGPVPLQAVYDSTNRDVYVSNSNASYAGPCRCRGLSPLRSPPRYLPMPWCRTPPPWLPVAPRVTRWCSPRPHRRCAPCRAPQSASTLRAPARCLPTSPAPPTTSPRPGRVRPSPSRRAP